jgi:hypothetical protein
MENYLPYPVLERIPSLAVPLPSLTRAIDSGSSVSALPHFFSRLFSPNVPKSYVWINFGFTDLIVNYTRI